MDKTLRPCLAELVGVFALVLVTGGDQSPVFLSSKCSANALLI